MTQAALSPINKKVLPAILATAIFMLMLDSTILNTSLPAIAADLDESPLNMQNAIISYVLTVALLMPISGFMADKFGTKRIFISSLVLFGLGSLFCSLSQSLDQLVLSRVIQGVGGSMMTPVGRLTLIKSYPKNEFVRAMNYAIVPALIGPILGPLVGGYMVDYLSWHWIFLINLPIAALGIILSLIYLPNFQTSKSEFDLKGFLIFAGATLFLSISLELLGNAVQITPLLLGLSLGFLLLYFYYRHAKKQVSPLFPLDLFQVRTFRVGIVGNLATRLGISSVPLLLPLMIQIGYGKSAVISGWIVAPMALTAMMGKSVVLKILKRFGYRSTLFFNTLLIGILISAIAIPSSSSSIYWHVPIIAVLGFFNSIQFTSMNTIAIANLRPNHTSSGNSLLSVNQQLSVGFGVAFGLLVLKLCEGDANLIQHDIHNAFRYTFLVIGSMTMISAFVFRRLHSRDGDNLKSQR